MDELRPLSDADVAAVGKRGNGADDQPIDRRLTELNDWLSESIADAATLRHQQIFLEDPEPPPVLIPGLIPCDVFGLVGPGGISKSTFLLWVMVHVVLGRRIFDRDISHPGACLYVSAEDPARVVFFRLRRICDAMGLSDEEREYVARDLHVEDWTCRLRRFVELGHDGNLQLTEWPGCIVQKYRNAAPALVGFDPAVFFGPGERFVNDAEASLMQAGRLVSQGFGGAAVCYVHHVGQAAARDGTVDQYAGRGGSAFADNSRAQLVMHAPSTDSKDYPRPLEISEEDFEEGRAFRLHVAKFSAGRRERQPVWVLRHAENPWRFETFVVQDPKGLSESRQKTHEVRAVRLVWEYVKGHQDNAPMTKTGLRALKIGGLTEQNIRTAVEQALASGYLVEAILPSEQQATRRKTGLRTGRMEPPKA